MVPEAARDDRLRVRPRGAEARPEARGRARHQPVQVRLRRLDRRPHRHLLGRGEQLLRQVPGQRAEPRALDRATPSTSRAAPIKDWQLGASGLTGVWATENTREAIWDAMKRKEVYATTGTRMFVRFFGGWDFAPSDALGRNPGAVGYGKGVPMGGDLPPAPDGASRPELPRRRAEGPALGQPRPHPDRQGLARRERARMQEHVYDVVWAGDRKPGEDGKVPLDRHHRRRRRTRPGPTRSARPSSSPSGPIPTSTRREKAFYYARVIEIPTPRWTAYDAAYFEERRLRPRGADDRHRARLHLADLVHAVAASWHAVRQGGQWRADTGRRFGPTRTLRRAREQLHEPFALVGLGGGCAAPLARPPMTAPPPPTLPARGGADARAERRDHPHRPRQ